jgi:hypothetical protein
MPFLYRCQEVVLQRIAPQKEIDLRVRNDVILLLPSNIKEANRERNDVLLLLPYSIKEAKRERNRTASPHHQQAILVRCESSSTSCSQY